MTNFPLVLLLALCSFAAAPFEGASLSCTAEQAIVCSDGACDDRPDENPHAEVRLMKSGHAGDLCMVTACRPVSWTRTEQGIAIHDGADTLSLHVAEDGTFRLVRTGGIGWRGSCTLEADEPAAAA